ncbi:MAG: Fic family protein [Conexibacter sp.]
MRSFSDIGQTLAGIPSELVRLLASIEYGRGREDLFRAQAPQVLERLAARTRFDSITASSAIENVVVDDDRALKLLREPSTDGPYRDRSEAELAGYRDATDELLRKEHEPLTVPLVLHVHRLLMRHTGDPLAGKLKTSDNVIGDLRPEGRVTVVFKPVPAGPQTERQLAELVERYEEALAHDRIAPLLLLAALVLDFLAIHPFQDGNGRVARLLTANELLRHGYGVVRFVSIEQRVFESKNSYYAALRASQTGWHEGRHDLWPWTGYLLRVLADAYEDFARRVAAGTELVGTTKEEQARNYILTQAPRSFRFAQIADALPDISQATIRNALDGLKSDGVLSVGRGRSASWTRTDQAAHRARAAD